MTESIKSTSTLSNALENNTMIPFLFNVTTTCFIPLINHFLSLFLILFPPVMLMLILILPSLSSLPIKWNAPLASSSLYILSPSPLSVIFFLSPFAILLVPSSFFLFAGPPVVPWWLTSFPFPLPSHHAPYSCADTCACSLIPFPFPTKQNVSLSLLLLHVLSHQYHHHSTIIILSPVLLTAVLMLPLPSLKPCSMPILAPVISSLVRVLVRAGLMYLVPLSFYHYHSLPSLTHSRADASSLKSQAMLHANTCACHLILC